MTALTLALACGTGAALLIIALNRLALIPWQRAREAHWTERARRLYPARISAIQHVLYVSVLGAILREQWWPHTPLAWPGAAASAFLGAQLGTFFHSRTVFPFLTFRTWLAEIGVAYLFRILAWATLVVAGFAMPARFDVRAALLALAAIAAQIALLHGLGLKIGALIGVIDRAPQRVDRIVAGVAALVGIPPPESLVIRSIAANALAAPHLRKLIFTTRLLEELSDGEIAAIAAHEIAHLTEPPGVVRTRMLSAFILTPLIFIRPIFAHFDTIGILVLAVFVVLAAVFVQRLARRMEQRADALAVAHSGPDPAVYAHALEHIYRLNQMPAVMRGTRLAHPHLYDRLTAAGVPPDYPRPSPPTRQWWTQALLITFIIIAMLGREFFR